MRGILHCVFFCLMIYNVDLSTLVNSFFTIHSYDIHTLL